MPEKHIYALQKKRVLVIGGLSDSLINFRWPLIEAFSRNGYEVHGCAAGESPEVTARFQKINGAYHPLHLKRTGLNPKDDIWTLYQMYRLMQTIRPEIVLAYTIKPVVYGLLAAKFTNISKKYALITGLGYAFTDDRGSAVRKAVRSVATHLYKTSLKAADHVFFQNSDDQQLFLTQGLLSPSVSTTVVNGSGVDLTFFTETEQPTSPVFLLIARLLKDKGIREYANAAKQVKQKYPEARFLLAGPFDTNPSAIKQDEVDEWTRGGVIEYLGALRDVRPAIAQCNVYVLPSYREGTPRTVLEAMAMGRAVITTDVPGCKETVAPGVNGVLVPHKNVEHLAQAMEDLIAQPELRIAYGRRGRILAEEKFDAEQVSKKMIEIMSHRAAAS